MKIKTTILNFSSKVLYFGLSLVIAGLMTFGMILKVLALEAMTPLMRASVNSGSAEGNDDSAHPAISADGRYVAFYSSADNLVPDDTNSVDDIFRKDMQTGEIIRISTSSTGDEADSSSGEPSISADGRYIAFGSYATNLVDGDTNGQQDIFVKDVITGVTTRVSTDSAGAQADSWSQGPSISADGLHIAFSSHATNLVDGDTNGRQDVFVKDMDTNETERLSVSEAGIEGNNYSSNGVWYSGGKAISADGQYVVFRSTATNLISGGGDAGIVVKNRQNGEVIRVAVDDAGYGGGSITPDGRFVAANIWDGDYAFIVMDLQTHVVERVDTSAEGDPPDGYTEYDPSISADGRFVVFTSTGSNLVTSDTNSTADIFVKDRATGDISRVSTDSIDTEADGYNYEHSISADGNYIVFSSVATNLTPNDTNSAYDIFYRANPFATILEDKDFTDTSITAGSNSGTVLSNATKNGSPLNTSEYTLSITDDDSLSGATINTDGTIEIPSDAASGNYTLTYEACETAAPDYCTSAIVQVAVLGDSNENGQPGDTGAENGQTPGVPDTGTAMVLANPLLQLAAVVGSGLLVIIKRTKL